MHSTTSAIVFIIIRFRLINSRTVPPSLEFHLKSDIAVGPESMSVNRGPSPTPFHSSIITTPKPSSRCPGLASIFRIGNNKTKSAVLHTGADVVDPATLPSAFGASEHDISAVQCNSSTSGTGGVHSNIAGEEEDWDRMDSASDLDAAAIKALGLVDGPHDVSATVRGRGRFKTKAGEKKRAGVSPYLQNQPSYENDQHHPPLPASSSTTGLGSFLARHSIIRRHNNAADNGPFTSISASPPESATKFHVGNHSSFDSIIDDEQKSSQEDSLYHPSLSYVCMVIVPFQSSLLLLIQFLPLSVHGIGRQYS